MTTRLGKHKNRKKIALPTLIIFYLIVYFDKFCTIIKNSYVIRKIKIFTNRIRNILHWHLKHPDLYFDEKWEINEFYPFSQDKIDQFTIKVRDRWFFTVLIVFIIAAITAIITTYTSTRFNDITIHLIVIVSGITSLALWTKKTLIIDHEDEEYMIIWYKTILYTQPIHNIYLRIYEISKSPADKSYYQLVIQASKMPAVSLSRLSTDEERIRRIGHILSEKININFFEFEDLSHNHIIRHWPVLPSSDENNISPPPKTDFFQMKSMRTLLHVGSGLAIKSFYEFEKILTGQQSKRDSEHVSESSISTAKSSLKETPNDNNNSWKKKPLRFFKRIFPSSRNRKMSAKPNSSIESSISRPGTSFGSPSRFSDGSAPSLTKRNLHNTSSYSDSMNQKSFLRDLQQKIQSAQAVSSEESLSLSSLSEVSIRLESSETESDNERAIEKV